MCAHKSCIHPILEFCLYWHTNHGSLPATCRALHPSLSLSVLFAGFSLGGGLTELGAVWAAYRFPRARVMAATQGAPKVGNADYSTMYRGTVGIVYRFVYNMDEVSSLPPLSSYVITRNQLWITRDQAGGAFEVLLSNRPNTRQGVTTWVSHPACMPPWRSVEEGLDATSDANFQFLLQRITSLLNSLFACLPFPLTCSMITGKQRGAGTQMAQPAGVPYATPSPLLGVIAWHALLMHITLPLPCVPPYPRSLCRCDVFYVPILTNQTKALSVPQWIYNASAASEAAASGAARSCAAHSVGALLALTMTALLALA